MSHERAHALALAEVHVAVVLFGFAGLFGKWLALAPVLLVLGRTVVAATALVALRAVRREARVPFDIRLAANGVVLAIHWTAFFTAIQVSTVAIGLLGHASFPLFVLAFERAYGRRPIDARELITAALVTVGLVVLIPEFSWSNRAVHGLAYGVLAGATFALLAVLNRRWAASRPATDVALWQNAWAAVALAIAAAFIAQAPTFTVRDAALVVVLGVVCTAGAHSLFIASMKRLSAHTASVVAALEPVYGIALAWLLLGESPPARTLAGGLLIIGAALVASRRAQRSDSVELPT